jgi:AraC-like DNA-binding protein
MPLFMDRHDVSPTVTAENVAQLHHEDLKVQHLFNCRGLTYWFDERRKTAFCLVEAPNAEAIRHMHAKAHGQVPNQIIEVEAAVVESFLGRIEDPQRASNAELNIINDPAFRTIMVIQLRRESFTDGSSLDIESSERLSEDITRIIKTFQGGIVKHAAHEFLISFKSATKAINSAIEVYSLFRPLAGNTNNSTFSVRIGLSASAPLTKGERLFEDATKLAERLCEVEHDKIMISQEVKELHNSENAISIDREENIFFSFGPADEKLFTKLMAYIESSYSDAYLTIHDFASSLGLSKSKLYRKMVILTGKSLNVFLKDYRLNEAMNLLRQNLYSISEIAYETGFTSPSYFSKCFRKKYGEIPSALKHA